MKTLQYNHLFLFLPKVFHPENDYIISSSRTSESIFACKQVLKSCFYVKYRVVFQVGNPRLRAPDDASKVSYLKNHPVLDYRIVQHIPIEFLLKAIINTCNYAVYFSPLPDPIS